MAKADLKDAELRCRAAPWLHEILKEAAKAAGCSVSEIVRGAARREARRILAAENNHEEGGEA